MTPDLATLRAKLAAAERGEIGDPDPGQKVDHDLVDFLRFKIGQADTAGAFRREVAARDVAHSFDRKHAMNHAEALARAIRDAGGPKTTRAWQSPAGDTRVYFPEPAGYLSIGADGSVSETQRGKVTFYPSGLYREWARGVRTGREAYQASFRERMDRHAAEVVAAVAKVRGNPRRGPVRRRPLKTVPFNPRATRTVRRNPEAVPIASGLIVNPRRNPAELREAIRRSLTPELLKKPYRAMVEAGECDPLTGHCYVASEAYYHMAGGAAAGLKPMSIQHEGGPHWWIRTKDGQDIDITAAQFRTPVPYAKGVGKGFLTREPSKRAQEVIRRAALQNPRPRANPPVPTNDYRSAATRESTPLHIWWSNVLDLAGVTHAQSLTHRAQVNRWYQAGEPAWMAADGLRLLVRKQSPRRNPATSIRRFTYLGTSDEVDACDCCGKSDLKSTVAILDNDSGETLYFGTTCAARALKQTVKEVKAGTAAADRAKAEAERKAQQAKHDAEMKEWKAYLIAATGGGVRETYGQREWVGDDVTGGWQYPLNLYATAQLLGGMKGAREGFAAWKSGQAKQNPRQAMRRR